MDPPKPVVDTEGVSGIDISLDEKEETETFP